MVDLGAKHSSVIPVHEGFVLSKQTMQSSGWGGNALDALFLDLLKRKHGAALKKWTIEGSESYQLKKRYQVMQQMKESICRVNDVAFTMEDNLAIPTVSYDLPDGQKLQIGPERFEVPEILFRDEDSHPSIQKMVLNATNQCEIDMRRDFFHNMVLTGGTSCFENTPQRLERELSTMVPAMFKVKVVASHPTERKNSAWLGGSILGSLSTLENMIIWKKEYEEYGTSILQRKCI